MTLNILPLHQPSAHSKSDDAPFVRSTSEMLSDSVTADVSETAAVSEDSDLSEVAPQEQNIAVQEINATIKQSIFFFFIFKKSFP